MGSIIKIYSNNQIKCLSCQTSKIQSPDTPATSRPREPMATSTFNNKKSQESRSQVSILQDQLLIQIIHIGYCGYIPGIVSENVFGETYGKTSYASSAKTFERGMDEPAHKKYNTTMKKEFIDHAARTDKVETTAEQVGVVRTEDVYKKVSTFLQLFIQNV